MKLISSSVDRVMYSDPNIFGRQAIGVAEFSGSFQMEGTEIAIRVHGQLAGELDEIAYKAYIDANPLDAEAEQVKAIFAYLAKHVGTQP